MRHQKNLFPLISLLFCAAPVLLPAQTAAELDAILESSAMNCAEAAWFVYASTAESPDIDAPPAAFAWAMHKGWLPARAAPDDPVTLGTLSFLIMQAFDLKGGLLYRIFPGPRYAFRSMVSRSFIQGAADPAMQVSGERFLMILGNVLEAAGETL